MNYHYTVDHEFARQVGARIREQRIKRGMTQRQLAQAIGQGQNSITQYESGRNLPSVLVLLKTAKVFRCSVEALCGEKEYVASVEIRDLKRENIRLWKMLMQIRSDLIDEADKIRVWRFPDPLDEEAK